MKWKKLGKVFDPRSYACGKDCIGFAQSPQALVCSDHIRVYFSTRTMDRNNGKHLSHVAFIDFSKDFRNIVNISKHEVIRLGNCGCYDEHGIFPFNVFRHEGRILGYIGGWSRRVSVSVETSIGLSISEDEGDTFERWGDGPILASSPNEPFLVGDPFVAHMNGCFHMWYIFGTHWRRFPGEPCADRVYKIGHAVSEDGFLWHKETEGKQIIIDKLNADECQALPTVMHYQGLYHMFFCYREATDFRNNSSRSYRIGYASSEDLSVWVRDDKKVGIDITEDEWDSDMLCYPNVFNCDGKYYMLYNGNEFGRYGFGLAVLDVDADANI